MKYQTRPKFVEATRWYRHGDHPQVTRVETSLNEDPYLLEYWQPEYGYLLGKRVKPGDWIVEGPLQNQIYVMTDEEFRKEFTRTPDEEEPRTVGH